MDQTKKRDRWALIFSTGILAALFAVVAWLILPNVKRVLEGGQPIAAIGYSGQTVPARVIEILEEGEILLGDRLQHYQVFRVELLQGEHEGMLAEVDYGRRQIIPSGTRFQAGDAILVWTDRNPMTNELYAHFVDYIRSSSILILFGMFICFSVLISGWKGVRSLGGIGFSLLIIIFYIVPQIVDGNDPVWVSITGSLLFLSISLYLVYGWTMKTHAAVIGMAISLTLTGLLALFSISLTRLTGFGDESAMYLYQQAPTTLDMRGLLLAGMLIGALGVLDDLVIGQSSAVFELRAANSLLGMRTLYRRAMNIGRDHVAATVNTLVLAYAGASLPMLLLFSLNSHDYGLLVNNSFIAEEIVRTLVGSIGLFAAVPITTFIACLLALYRGRLGCLGAYLGPDNSWESESVFQVGEELSK